MKRNIMQRAVRGVRRNYSSYTQLATARYPDASRRFQPLTDAFAKPKVWATTAFLAVITIVTVNIATQTQQTPASYAAATVGIEAELGTISSPATSIDDVTASGGKAVRFGSVSCAAGPGLPGGPDLIGGCWPGPDSTGYRAAPDYPGSLTTASTSSSTCPLPIRSNFTYRFCRFGSTSVGTRAAPVSNVAFYGSLFKDRAVEGALVMLFGDNLTFEYSSFEPNVEAPPTPYNQSYQYGLAFGGSYYSNAGKLTVSHSDFWGFGNAIDGAGSTQAKPHVFRDNWIHDAAEDGGSYHTDGIGNTSGSGNESYVIIDHNTIVSKGNTNGIAFQQGTYSNFTVTNNLLGGFGYTVVIWAPAPNTIFTDNAFTTLLRPGYGPLYPQSFWTSNGSQWQRNKWLVPAGAEYGSPADSGKFWTPSGVSATDYGG